MKGRPLAVFGVLLALLWVSGFAFQGCASVKVKTRNGVFHTVRPGETLWRICYVYRVNMETVGRFNDIRNPEAIQAGQTIFIPGVDELREVPPAKREVPRDDESGKAQGPSGGKSSAFRSGARGPGRSSDRSALNRKASKLEFIWPLKGPVTNWFGVSNGRRHDGIDIAVPRGTPIHAAEAGKVIYSDNGISGYGNLVILQHPGEFTSVYAHNHRNLVKVDQTVKKGQAIAEVGDTGRAEGCHLHFEIRYDAKPVDPMDHLP